MHRIIFIIVSVIIFCGIIAGCGGKDKMYKARKKGPGGLPAMQPQIAPDKVGQSVIKLTDQIRYPGMEPYEDSYYDFVAKETTDVVAKWFEENLEGETINKKSFRGSAAEYIVFFKNYEINIVIGPHGNDTLIRYKLALDKKK